MDGDTFKDYIKTKVNPSTPTIGHTRCGLVFNFVDDEHQKRYSSKKELKSLALKFTEINKFEYEVTEVFLLEVDRLKSRGNMEDVEILMNAYESVLENFSLGSGRWITRDK